MRILRFVLVAAVLCAIASAVGAQGTDPRPILVSGTIAAIDLDRCSIVVKAPPSAPWAPAPEPVKFFYTDKTRFFKNGVEARPEDLSIGDLCEAECVREASGRLVALVVRAKTPPPPPLKWAKGRIGRINYDERVFELLIGGPDSTAPRVMNFFADEETKIRKDGAPAGFRQLRSGDLAAVGFVPPPTDGIDPTKPIRASAIEAKTPPEAIGHVRGKLVELDLEGRVIGVLPNETPVPGADPVLRFFVPERCQIDKFGRVPLEALCVEDKVGVAFLKSAETPLPPALTITVKANSIAGIIDRVNPENGLVSLRKTPLSPSIVFRVLERTRIVKDGKPAILTDLKPGDAAKIAFFHFPDVNVAAEIVARSLLR